jgi:polysaccharide biosynthesis protein PslH
MRILVHASTPVYPFFDGTQLRTFHVTPYLAERHTLDLVQERWPWEETTAPISPTGYPADWLNRYFRKVVNVWHTPGERLRYRMVRHCPELYRVLDDVLATGNYDAIYAPNESFPLYAYDRRCQDLPVLTGPTDSEHLHYRRALRLARHPRNIARLLIRWGLYRLYQVRVLNKMTYWTMVAERDAADMRRLSGKCKIRVIPNGVDSDWTALPPNYPRDSRTVVFLGTLGSDAVNEVAVKWLLKFVWPAVVTLVPGAKLAVVGRDPSSELRDLGNNTRNVTVTGYLADPRPYLWQAGIFVLPMRSGAGIKNKLLEAWAAGCAVVSTPLGVEGVAHAVDKSNVLLAARPQAIVGALVDLMNDAGKQQSLGEMGRQTATQYYGWRAVAAQLEGYLLEISKGFAGQR